MVFCKDIWVSHCYILGQPGRSQIQCHLPCTKILTQSGTSTVLGTLELGTSEPRQTSTQNLRNLLELLETLLLGTLNFLETFWNLHLEPLHGTTSVPKRCTHDFYWNSYLEPLLGTSEPSKTFTWNMHLEPLRRTFTRNPFFELWNLTFTWNSYLEPWNLLKTLLATLEPPGFFTWNPSLKPGNLLKS